MDNNMPMIRNGVYQNNPDVLGKISELDLAVKELGGSNNTDNLATKDDIKGMVKKVNNNLPDANGNVTISIPSVTGMVKSVNTAQPDANGNVTIAIPSVTGMVKNVNGSLPDGTGKVTLNLFPSGTTAQRPSTGTVVGQYFFDTTLNKPLYRNATNNGWVDGTGTPVT
ncbi:UNVERIFIED_ORG: putative tail fiber-like protein [Xanthomonas phage Xoo-sp15]